MLAFPWLPGQPHTNTSPPGAMMAILLDRIHDYPLDFSASPGSPHPCLLNQSQRDCELGLWYSEGSRVDDSSLGPAMSFVLPIIYTLICASGVLANGLVISVVLGCKQKVVSDIYILNLAVADLLFLVGMPFIIHQFLQEQGWIFGDFLCWAATTIDLNNQFSSVAIVTLLCVDRYVAVVYSSTIGQKRNLRCTALINAGVWAGSLALATPAMLYTRVHWDNKTEICLIDLPGPHSVYWYTLYQSLVAFLLPLLVITVLYSLTLHHLFRTMRRVQRKASARSRKVTRMALTIIAAFFVCWTPYHVLQLVNLTATPSRTFFYFYQASICLSYAHSCVSPILVIFCTEFFRERMARTRWDRKRKGMVGGDSAEGNAYHDGMSVNLPSPNISSNVWFSLDRSKMGPLLGSSWNSQNPITLKGEGPYGYVVDLMLGMKEVPPSVPSFCRSTILTKEQNLSPGAPCRSAGFLGYKLPRVKDHLI